MADSRVFLCCSGSEAVDSAMKLARIAHVQAGQPQRKLIISRVRGYHGVAYGGTSAQGIAPNARTSARSSPTWCRCPPTTSRHWRR
jgi:adenosylmethionine-8-amino-7-oxononanoate aminotransferase